MSFVRAHSAILRPLLAFVAFAGIPAGLSAQSYGVTVSPDGAYTPNKLIHTTGNTYTFRVENTGSCDPFAFECISFTLNCVGASNVTCTNWPAGVLVAPGSYEDVVVTFSTGNEGTGSLTVTASSSYASDQGNVVVPVVIPAGGPRMSVLPYLEAKQDYSRCLVNCFAAAYAHSTVPYVSLDAPRSVTLAYHGDRVAPRPFVLVDVRPDSSFGSWPTEYQLQVKVGGSLVTFVNGETTLRFGNPGNQTYRIGGQFVATGYTHGTVYSMEILASTKIGATLYTNRWITRYLHIDEAKSPIARGWTLVGIQRAFIVSLTGVLVTEGDGSATYFKYNQITGKYEAPAGDFSTLKQVGSTWVRAYGDSTKVTFNSSGQMVRVADRWGVRDTILYTSGKVTQIKDHLNNTITLAYGASGLSSITDPYSRVTTVSVASDSTLSWIQDPDNLKTSFGYDGSRRLTTVTARNNKVTTLAYDSQSGKVSTITEPSIPLFGGGTGQPVTSFGPWQKLGVPYVATSGTPFPPVLPDTAYARLTEPGGALTRFSVNRWGSPVRTIGPLADGTRDTTTARYTPEGLVASVRRAGFGTTPDSMAYNGSGLPVYSKPASAPATRATYGAFGQAVTMATEGQDSTTYFRGSLGRVDSVRVGSTTVARYASYDAFGRPLVIRRPGADTTTFGYFGSGSHRNLNTVTLSGGRTITYRYDSKGLMTYRKLPLVLADSIVYDVMNRVTAQRRGTTGSSIVTSFQYDSMSNVTQVTDPKGQIYKYRYNALGWLVRQEDPATMRDTMQYSIDGDVLRRTDRRNLTVDFTYDSLHRVKTRIGSDTVSFSYPSNSRVLVGV